MAHRSINKVIEWRDTQMHPHPWATSVLACWFSNEQGDWVFDVLDVPTPGELQKYQYWCLLSDLTPTLTPEGGG
jgi:hypothetical protein